MREIKSRGNRERKFSESSPYWVEGELLKWAQLAKLNRSSGESELINWN